MIPSHMRLYTWVDIDDLLRLGQKSWPEWMVHASAYWDCLQIAVRPGTVQSACKWLEDQFEPRFDDVNMVINLESHGETKRNLSVLIEETDEQPPAPTFRPTFSRRCMISGGQSQWEHPPALPEPYPPVIAFHSFKGGVGRTVHALSLACAITQRSKDASVLLVDADLEAPGLTWIFRDRFPDPSISFADCLALLHGDSSPGYEESLELVVNRISSLQTDGIYTLSAFRSQSQFSFEIRPEHVIQGADDPFFLTEFLARVGAKLKVEAVIIDLRAGLSELAAGLLLDPRVYRVVVSTLSDQSIQGACLMFERLGELSPSLREHEPFPAVILSQIPSGKAGDTLADGAEERIQKATQFFLDSAQLASEEEQVPKIREEVPRLRTGFESSLQALSGSWAEVLTLVRDSGISREVASLLDWLPAEATQARKTSNGFDLKKRRESLAEYSKRLIFAETGEIKDFLATLPLRRLASDFRAKVPNVVIVGAKGAGKTFAFLQAVRRKKWQQFIVDIGADDVSVKALLCPTLASMNVKESARKIINNTLEESAKLLGLADPAGSAEVKDALRNGVMENLHEGQWRERWLNVIAWSIGFEANSSSAGRRLPEYLRERGQCIVATLDGLEDVFQEVSSEPRQQTALRALLQDLPDWLSQQPGQPIGLVVFVRRDMVLNAVRQNSAQLLERYEPYSLGWDELEALRLAAWLGAKAGVLPDVDISWIEQADKRGLVESLVPLWGRKLGRDRSREARSAEWVIAALSDLRRQIQARDVVRFICEAAIESSSDPYWKERLLVPMAARKAVSRCSAKKIDEIAKENMVLNRLFNKLKNLRSDQKQLPFTIEEVGFDYDELSLLEDNGAILREGQDCYMPEIFRLGLGFSLKSGARPRVMTMARRARR